MKKRVLSLLLLLAMLVTMVPTMSVSAGATENSGEEPPRNEEITSTPVSDFYSLYKTENLIAFFDALDPNNGTLDLAEGKWYARVFNKGTGKWEKSDTIYATIKGGAYDAENNPTGWKTYASGFGFEETAFKTTENVVEFDYTKLLHNGPARHSNWAVEALVKVNLRDIPLERVTISGDDLHFESIEEEVKLPEGEALPEGEEPEKVKFNKYTVSVPKWSSAKSVTLKLKSDGYVPNATIYVDDAPIEGVSFKGEADQSVSNAANKEQIVIKLPENIELVPELRRFSVLVP